MKKWATSLSLVTLLLAAYYGVRWFYPRWLVAVVAGKSPRTAVATVVKKEYVRSSNRQETVRFPNGTSITLKDEHFYVWYRLDDFLDVEAAASAAIARRERIRFKKDGPRRMEIGEREFEQLSDGGKMTVQYAYYPNVLWGVSDEIRVPW
jgi:hypothetical protein